MFLKLFLVFSLLFVHGDTHGNSCEVCLKSELNFVILTDYSYKCEVKGLRRNGKIRAVFKTLKGCGDAAAIIRLKGSRLGQTLFFEENQNSLLSSSSQRPKLLSTYVPSTLKYELVNPELIYHSTATITPTSTTTSTASTKTATNPVATTKLTTTMVTTAPTTTTTPTITIVSTTSAPTKTTMVVRPATAGVNPMVVEESTTQVRASNSKAMPTTSSIYSMIQKLTSAKPEVKTAKLLNVPHLLSTETPKSLIAKTRNVRETTTVKTQGRKKRSCSPIGFTRRETRIFCEVNFWLKTVLFKVKTPNLLAWNSTIFPQLLNCPKENYLNKIGGPGGLRLSDAPQNAFCKAIPVTEKLFLKCPSFNFLKNYLLENPMLYLPQKCKFLLEKMVFMRKADRTNNIVKSKV